MNPIKQAAFISAMIIAGITSLTAGLFELSSVFLTSFALQIYAAMKSSFKSGDSVAMTS